MSSLHLSALRQKFQPKWYQMNTNLPQNDHQHSPRPIKASCCIFWNSPAPPVAARRSSRCSCHKTVHQGSYWPYGPKPLDPWIMPTRTVGHPYLTNIYQIYNLYSLAAAIMPFPSTFANAAFLWGLVPSHAMAASGPVLAPLAPWHRSVVVARTIATTLGATCLFGHDDLIDLCRHQPSPT